jgi:hypothetical protein
VSCCKDKTAVQALERLRIQRACISIDVHEVLDAIAGLRTRSQVAGRRSIVIRPPVSVLRDRDRDRQIRRQILVIVIEGKGTTDAAQ